MDFYGDIDGRQNEAHPDRDEYGPESRIGMHPFSLSPLLRRDGKEERPRLKPALKGKG